MTITNDLELLKNTKADIASAIRENGVEMPEDTPFSEYPKYIKEITKAVTDWGILYTTTYPDGKELTEADYLALGSSNYNDYSLSFGTVPKTEILSFDFGIKPTTIPNFFLSRCANLKSISAIPDGITIIPNGFIQVCKSFNSPVVLPDTVTTIGQYFMQSCVAFNSPVILSSNLKQIANYFLDGCKSFAQPLTIPASVTLIGPANFSASFMRDCDDFTGPLYVACSSSVIQEEDNYNNLSVSISNASSIPPAYAQGVKLTGPYAQNWKDYLGDMPYSGSGSETVRKLTVVSD